MFNEERRERDKGTKEIKRKRRKKALKNSNLQSEIVENMFIPDIQVCWMVCMTYKGAPSIQLLPTCS
jgi:hypothetical protein